MEQQVGPGSLNIARAFEVQQLSSPAEAGGDGSVGAEPSARQGWLALANDYAHPDPPWVLRGVVQLRSASGAIAHGLSASRLRLEATPARVVEPLDQAAPGLWRFGVAAPAGTGGQRLRLRVTYDERTLITREVPIAVDRWVAQEGVRARGGCSIGLPGARRRADAAAAWLLTITLLTSSALRRRSRSTARRGVSAK